MSVIRAILPYSLFLYAIACLTSMAGMEIFGWLTGVLALLLILSRKGQGLFPVPSRSDWILWGLLGVILLGAILSPVRVSPIIEIVGAGRWVVLFFLLRFAFRETWSAKDFEGLFYVLAAVICVIAVCSLAQFFTGFDIVRPSRVYENAGRLENGWPIYRSTGFFGSPMTYGHSAALFVCFPLAVYFLRVKAVVKYHKFMAATSGLVLLSLLTTLTRGVWLAVVSSLLVMSFYLGLKRTFQVLVVIGLSVGLAFWLVSDLRSRALSIFDPSYGSNAERFVMWEANLEMANDYPLLGVGLNENEKIVQTYFDRMGLQGQVGHAHNNIVQMLSGTGYLGLALYLIFMLYSFWLSHRLWTMIPPERKWDKAVVLGALGAQVALHVGGLTECNFKDAEVNHQFILILALVQAMHQVYRDEHSGVVGSRLG